MRKARASAEKDGKNSEDQKSARGGRQGRMTRELAGGNERPIGEEEGWTDAAVHLGTRKKENQTQEGD